MEVLWSGAIDAGEGSFRSRPTALLLPAKRVTAHPADWADVMEINLSSSIPLFWLIGEGDGSCVTSQGNLSHKVS